jgi:hypothetical protein
MKNGDIKEAYTSSYFQKSLALAQSHLSENASPQKSAQGRV